MATITPTNQVNAATMAKNWGPGVTSNAQKWLNKYLNPKRLYNADPTGAQAAWNAGIAQAQAAGSYATGLANSDPTAAANNASTFGVTNYANSGTAKAAKYAATTQALASAENAVLNQLASMPKGKGANNENRMLAWSRGMAAYKGKIKQ